MESSRAIELATSLQRMLLEGEFSLPGVALASVLLFKALTGLSNYLR